MFQRDTQIGGRGEVGVRLTGGSAAVELFVAFERRIDADPLDLVARRWTTFGFRLLSQVGGARSCRLRSSLLSAGIEVPVETALRL